MRCHRSERGLASPNPMQNPGLLGSVRKRRASRVIASGGQGLTELTRRYILVGMEGITTTERPRKTRRTRDPVGTREAILNAAFDEIHRNGFRSAGLDAILAEAGVTKGALYHHFGSKKALGAAVIEEVIRPFIIGRMAPLATSDDPLATFIRITHDTAAEMTEEEMACGCPLNNLAQELAGIDEAFRSQIAGLMAEWREILASGLRRGQKAGTVRADLDPEAAALFLVATWEGMASIAKVARDPAARDACLSSFEHFLGTLRP